MPRARELKDLRCTRRLEAEALRRGWRLVAGTDEAGRGALLGPLYAAAVILDPGRPIHGVNDSKKLNASERLRLAGEIRAQAIAYKVASICAADVDRWNVYEASRRAMIQALLDLMPQPDFILTDAMRLDSARVPALGEGLLARSRAVNRGDRAFPIPYRAIIHGDARSVSIAAASILAKVARDAHLEELDRQFPQYSLARNKGYGTAEHLEALQRFGPCSEHRRTYQPVKDQLLPLFPEKFD